MRILLFVFLSYFQITATFSKTMNVKDVLEAAKNNNLSIREAKEKINESNAQTGLAKSFLYPTVNWSLSGTRAKEALYTGSPKFDGDPYSTYSSDLKLTQNLYVKGSLAGISIIEQEKKINLAKLHLIERDLEQKVIETFYRFILYQGSLENLLKNHDILKKSLVTSNGRYQKGRGLLLDILQIKTQIALQIPQIEEAKNQITISGLELLKLMGSDSQSPLNINGKLKTLLLSEVKKILNFSNMYLPEYEVNQLQLNQLAYSKEMTLGKHYPLLRLVGDYFYNNYKKADLFADESNSWAIQLQLVIPLFSGLSSRDEYSILQSQESQLRFAREDLERSLNLKQISSMKNLESAETSLISYELALKMALDAQIEAGRMYKVSQIDLLQYLNVQQAVLQAKSSLDKLKYQSIIAYSDYFVASGIPLKGLIDLLVENK